MSGVLRIVHCLVVCLVTVPLCIVAGYICHVHVSCAPLAASIYRSQHLLWWQVVAFTMGALRQLLPATELPSDANWSALRQLVTVLVGLGRWESPQVLC